MTASVGDRVAGIDWDAVARDLDTDGYAVTGKVLGAAECNALIASYNDDDAFRSVIDMRRHNFGSGEYKYFARPLPAIVDELRHALYAPLVQIANEWAGRLGTASSRVTPLPAAGRGARAGLRSVPAFPATLDEFVAQCHAAGQTKPTPLLLRYETGDYNALHQDVYGELGFPLQVSSVLSANDAYTGGEVLLVTQRPRAQSTGEAITLERGQLLVFPNRLRPVAGTRGDYRVNVRHGVSRLRSGERYTLGIIFHDAT